MTITIQLPDELGTLLRADAERERRPIEAVAADRLAGWYEIATEPDPIAIDAIREGLEDIEAGRTISLEEYERLMQAEHAARRAARNPASTV
jgi:predicted transcriptional regulator